MVYEIRFVEDDELPGHEWVIAKHDDAVVVFIAESADYKRVMAEAWAGYRILARQSELDPAHDRTLRLA